MLARLTLRWTLRTLLWPGIALAALLLAGCGTKKGPPPTPQIGLVATTAGFGDRSFNDAARAGLEACRQENIVVVTTAAPADDSDIESKLVLFATEKVDTIVGIGYGTAPALATVARRFEDSHFALIDAVADQPNVESVTFDEAQGAFLAGALAALVSKTHRVAFIGGADVPLLQRSEAGFSAGAREADPRSHVAIRYLTSFENAAAARDAAAALLAEHDDVLYIVAGPAGLGAIGVVQRSAHAYAIGADSNQDAIAPGKVLASVVKNVAGAALRVCRETVGGKSESGHVVLGLADDGIGLTGFTYTKAVVGRANIARIARLRDAIVAGRIAVPATRAALARFAPVSIP